MSELEFKEYLQSKKLSDSSIMQYLAYFRLFEKQILKRGLDQEVVTKFIIKHNSNVTRAFLKSFFDFYNINELKIVKPSGRKPKKKKKSMSPQEMKLIRNYLYSKNWRWGLMLDLSYHCALRREEVLNIRPENFDLLKWKEDISLPCRLKIEGKGSKERLVVVPPALMKIVVKYMKELNELYEGEKLFKAGKTLWHNAFKEAVKNKLDYNYTLHDLRRSKATYWHEQGLDLFKIKTRLGHSSISTTQLYINPDEEKELENWEKEYKRED